MQDLESCGHIERITPHTQKVVNGNTASNVKLHASLTDLYIVAAAKGHFM